MYMTGGWAGHMYDSYGYPYSWRTITSICLPYPPFRLATNSADKLAIQIRPRIKWMKIDIRMIKNNIIKTKINTLAIQDVLWWCEIKW